MTFEVMTFEEWWETNKPDEQFCFLKEVFRKCFETASEDGYVSGYDLGYDLGHEDGHDTGYEQCKRDYREAP